LNGFDRLSQIQTLWSVVRRAHGDRSDQIRAAQQQILERYGGAARRYLSASLRDEDLASEAYQEFALRFVRGDFHRADPAKGRFRSFLKTSLHNLIVDFKKRRNAGAATSDQLNELCGSGGLAERDRAFTQSWRDELLARTWQALAVEESSSNKPLFTVLHFRAANPDSRSAELAAGLTTQLGREISAANVRVMLHRARERFADLMLDEVANSLDDPTPEAMEDELAELDLLEYCAADVRHRDTGGTASPARGVGR
jgi:RNA polymerase sigma-70 factor (ECF subfamily)